MIRERKLRCSVNITAPVLDRALALGAGRYGLQFGDGTDQVIVVWRKDDEAADALASVRLSAGATASSVDTMGNATPLTTAGSGIATLPWWMNRCTWSSEGPAAPRCRWRSCCCLWQTFPTTGRPWSR